MRTLNATQFSVYASPTGALYVRCPSCNYLMKKTAHRTYQCTRCADDEEWKLDDDTYSQLKAKVDWKKENFDSTLRACSRTCPEGEDYTFTCDLCGKLRGDNQRREPDSQICIQCVEAAGFIE